ncbi:hypothetical protein F5051DRAFT_444772 [Lentinula edodes]|nr:hypothetical protein F5051DRAFT_444772 [Lentinula edodes]
MFIPAVSSTDPPIPYHRLLPSPLYNTALAPFIRKSYMPSAFNDALSSVGFLAKALVSTLSQTTPLGMLPKKSSPPSKDTLLDALLGAFEKFDTLRSRYDKTRDEWRDEADTGVLATVRRAETIEQSLSANLDRCDGTLNRFSREIEAKIKDIDFDLHSNSEQAANSSLRAGIQMEVLRLVEMKVLLPEKMWHAEAELLQKLDEILVRSESSCDLADYVALQKASFTILQRVFTSLLSEDTQS